MQDYAQAMQDYAQIPPGVDYASLPGEGTPHSTATARMSSAQDVLWKEIELLEQRLVALLGEPKPVSEVSPDSPQTMLHSFATVAELQGIRLRGIINRIEL